MDYKIIIEEILDVYNLNASEFAEKIDVQRSGISHILSGRNKPSLEFLIKIKRAFSELRWDYILLGKKPMTESEYRIIENQRIERENDDYESPPTLPEFNFEVSKENEKVEIRDIMTSSIDEKLDSKTIKKIVWFYSDNSFEVFEN